MKITILALALILCCQSAQAQLKTTVVCPPFYVDVLEGTVNELHTYATMGEIKKTFPCFGNAIEETNGSTCGGVFFKEKDIYFFTERDYIEVGENFKGKLTLPLLGARRGSLFTTLGNPSIKDIDWDAYQTKFGILILSYNKTDKINKLQLSNKSTANLKLCE